MYYIVRIYKIVVIWREDYESILSYVSRAGYALGRKALHFVGLFYINKNEIRKYCSLNGNRDIMISKHMDFCAAPVFSRGNSVISLTNG